MPDDLVPMLDQRDALARISEAVGLMGSMGWRSDRCARAIAVLELLVYGMARDTGVVSGVTRAALAARAQVSEATVTRVLRWAREAGVVVVVEDPASAAFLGLAHGRCPSYAITAPTSTDVLDAPLASPLGKSVPQDDRGLERSASKNEQTTPWPFFDRTTTAEERGQAADRAMDHLAVPSRRRRQCRAMLAGWFADGWSVAGIVYAVHHRPGDPPGAPRGRGDALRGARDPLAVLGHRLGPWRESLDELPAEFRAVDGQARRARLDALAAAEDDEPSPRVAFVPTSTPEARCAWRTALGLPDQ